MQVFSFTPRSDAEIQAFQNRGLLSDGVYPFIVKAITSTFSQNSGNPMLEVVVGVLDHHGKERNIKDYLLATDEMIYKLKHFCESIGLDEEYKKGEFPCAKALGRRGTLKVGIQKGKARDENTFYPDKNHIKDYVKAAPIDQNKSVESAPFINDDIAF